MINFVKSSIDYVVDNKREFVVDDVHFSRNRDWPFPVFMNFMVFRKKNNNQAQYSFNVQSNESI